MGSFLHLGERWETSSASSPVHSFKAVVKLPLIPLLWLFHEVPLMPPIGSVLHSMTQKMLHMDPVTAQSNL